MRNYHLYCLKNLHKESEPHILSVESGSESQAKLIFEATNKSLGNHLTLLEIHESDRDFAVKSTPILEAVLSEISFENTALDFKWKYEVRENNDAINPGWFVNVAFRRPDCDTGEIGTGRGRAEFIAKGAWQSGIVKTGWLLVELVVRHELMEAFKWRGKRIFNPHNSVHDLAKIQ